MPSLREWFFFLALSILLFLLPRVWTSSVRTALVHGIWVLPAPTLPSEDAASPTLQRDAWARSVLERSDLRNSLRALATLREALPLPLPTRLLARVLMTRDSSEWRCSRLLDQGSAAGVRPGLPVVWGPTVIGWVAETGMARSRVLTVTDPAFRARAIAVDPHDANRRSEEGVCAGSGEDTAILKFVSADSLIDRGWYVLTSGKDGRFPRGLVLGRIVAAERNHRVLYWSIRLEPSFLSVDSEFAVVLVPPAESELTTPIDGR